ncbi:MAG: SGNH/GDSL hydrolase family protein [Candidatus Micrarchaeota archaeon]
MAVSIRRAESGAITFIVTHGGRTYRISGGNQPATEAGVVAARRHAVRGGLAQFMTRESIDDFGVAAAVLGQLNSANAATLAASLQPRAARAAAAQPAPRPAAAPRRVATPPPPRRRVRQDRPPPVAPPPAAEPEPPPEPEEERREAVAQPPPPPARRGAAISTNWITEHLRDAGGRGADAAVTEIHQNIDGINTFLSQTARARGALAFVLRALAQIPRFTMYATSQAPPEIAQVISLASAGTLTARHLGAEGVADRAVGFVHDYLVAEAQRTGTSEAAQAARQFGAEARGVASEIPSALDGNLILIASLYVRRMAHSDARVWHAEGAPEPPVVLPEPADEHEREGRQILAQEQRMLDEARARSLASLTYFRRVQQQPTRVVATEDRPTPEIPSRRRRAPRERPATAAPDPARSRAHPRPAAARDSGGSRRRAVILGDSLTAGLASGGQDGVHPLGTTRRDFFATLRPNVDVTVAGWSGNGVGRLHRRMREDTELRREVARADEIFIEAGANSIGWGAERRAQLHAQLTQLGQLRASLAAEAGDRRVALQQRIERIQEQLDQAVQERITAVTRGLQSMHVEARRINPGITIIAVGLPPMFGYGGSGELEERVRVGVNQWLQERVRAGDIPGLTRFVDLDRRLMANPQSTDLSDAAARRSNPIYCSDGVHLTARPRPGEELSGRDVQLRAYAEDGYPLAATRPVRTAEPARAPVPQPTPRVSDEDRIRAGDMPQGVRLR